MANGSYQSGRSLKRAVRAEVKSREKRTCGQKKTSEVRLHVREQGGEKREKGRRTDLNRTKKVRNCTSIGRGAKEGIGAVRLKNVARKKKKKAYVTLTLALQTGRTKKKGLTPGRQSGKDYSPPRWGGGRTGGNRRDFFEPPNYSYPYGTRDAAERAYLQHY